MRRQSHLVNLGSSLVSKRLERRCGGNPAQRLLQEDKIAALSTRDSTAVEDGSDESEEELQGEGDAYIKMTCQSPSYNDVDVAVALRCDS